MIRAIDELAVIAVCPYPDQKKAAWGQAPSPTLSSPALPRTEQERCSMMTRDLNKGNSPWAYECVCVNIVCRCACVIHRYIINLCVSGRWQLYTPPSLLCFCLSALGDQCGTRVT